MNELVRKELSALLVPQAAPCVSIFLPSAGLGRAARQERVRLRNLARSARAALIDWGLPERAADALLAPAAVLAADPALGARRGGVALYLATGFVRRLEVDFELPERFEIGDRFVIRPLLPLAARVERCYALAVSLNRVRVLDCGAEAFRVLALPGLPESFESAMGYVEYDSTVTAHTSSPSALGRRSAMFHGHGDGDEENLKDDVLHYLRRIVDVVEHGLAEPAAPVVFAAPASYFPLLRRANRRLRLLDEGLPGNPELLADATLAARAREVAAEAAERAVLERAARWRELEGSGRTASELGAILRAAEAGRIETLFLARDAERWGSFEPDLGRVEPHEERETGDVDLLDLAAASTLAHGGDVHLLARSAMPEGRIAAAILRYAVAA